MFKRLREKREARRREKAEAAEREKLKAFENYLLDLELKTLREALESVLKSEVKRKDENGKDVIDAKQTASLMKTKARVALEFIANLKKETKK